MYKRQKLISKKRTPVAKAIYSEMGGSSPILQQTEMQAKAAAFLKTNVYAGTPDFLLKILENESSLLLGQSGVGKSTLINWLLQEETIKTNMLSQKNQRGRHTTTTTKLHIMYNDTYLFDTPGMENPYPNISDKHQIQEGFREMVSNRNECKYRDCLHINEPKCSVKDSMLSNESSERRHSHYVKIFETIS